MTLLENLTIHDECLDIDEKHFINCTLVNCVLEYSGSDVVFEKTRFQGCRYVFFGRARRTVHFLQGTGLMAHQASDWGEFSPQVH